MPMFLFLVGISIAYSSAKATTENRGQLLRVARRTLLLIFINVALVNFPYYALDTMILHGTLTRIALCYFFVSLFNNLLGSRSQILIFLGILTAQWLLLTQYEVPGFGTGNFTMEGNASGYLERLILGDFADRFDGGGPVIQGIFPTASSVATTLVGLWVGRWLRSGPNLAGRTYGLGIMGLAASAAGWLWGIGYPISKPLWTGSYVILMTGISLLALAALNWLTEFRTFRILSAPLKVAGVNALFFYVLAQSFQRLLVYGRTTAADGTTTRYRYYIWENWFQPWVAGELGAFIYTATFFAICYVIIFVLYRNRLFVKL